MPEQHPTEAAVATWLAELPAMSIARLARLLDGRSPTQALRALRQGGVPASVADAKLVARWHAGLAVADFVSGQRRLDQLGVVVSHVGDPHHPTALADDLDASPVLFRRGRPIDEQLPAVAIVGTRRCSATGREVARELGFGLAAAGVMVVSGLALGIDGCAHDGALRAGGAPPLAFVGGGVDVVYPRRHAGLWERMIESGTVASEAPPGAPPAAWRFPARNRLIAAVADIVVVVESRAAGGSLLTVDEAIRRGREVMAVPGSVRNPAAAGTNGLLADGCAPVCGVDDVLAALGLSEASRGARRGSEPPPTEPVLGVSPDGMRVLAAVDDGPTSIDELVAGTGLGPLAVLAALGELGNAGLVTEDGARIRRLDRALGGHANASGDVR